MVDGGVVQGAGEGVTLLVLEPSPEGPGRRARLSRRVRVSVWFWKKGPSVGAAMKALATGSGNRKRARFGVVSSTPASPCHKLLPVDFRD